jgi:hypothetical protein
VEECKGTYMKYILITKNGKVMQFYIKDVAETYKTIYGGTIVATFPTEENIKRIMESV